MYAKVGVNYIAKPADKDKLSYLTKVFAKNYFGACWDRQLIDIDCFCGGNLA